MKKWLVLMLAVVMSLALVACGSDATAKLEKYVDENGEEMLASMEMSFATSSGMTCTSSIKVEDQGFVIDININELDNVEQSIKDQMQDGYDAISGTFDQALKEMQQELPEVKHLTVHVNEKDGDRLATIKAD